MTLFPLEQVRNASLDPGLEVALDDFRRLLTTLDVDPETDIAPEDVLDVFDVSRARLNCVVTSIKDRGSGIDIGTGFGFVPALAKRMGIDCLATERPKEGWAAARALGVVPHPWEIAGGALPFATASFDFVVLGEVLEHLWIHPRLAVEQVAGLLRPGGRLVLTTPNIARTENIELLTSGESCLEALPDPALTPDVFGRLEHVREYSVGEIVDAVENALLSCEDVLMVGRGERGYHPPSNPWHNDTIVVIAQV